MGRTFDSLEHCRYSCKYHVVFCPKYRLSCLVGGIDTRLKELLVEKVASDGITILEMEVMPDHVHLLLELLPTVAVGTQVGRLKGYTSRILRKEYPKLKSRLPSLWTNRYFVSSCGGVTIDQIRKYVENQKEGI